MHAAIQEHGIHEDDIWNFDETGFAMGFCTTSKVITAGEGPTLQTLVPRISRERKRHHGDLQQPHLSPRVRGTRARPSWNRQERNRMRMGVEEERI